MVKGKAWCLGTSVWLNIATEQSQVVTESGSGLAFWVKPTGVPYCVVLVSFLEVEEMAGTCS